MQTAVGSNNVFERLARSVYVRQRGRFDVAVLGTKPRGLSRVAKSAVKIGAMLLDLEGPQILGERDGVSDSGT